MVVAVFAPALVSFAGAENYDETNGIILTFNRCICNVLRTRQILAALGSECFERNKRSHLTVMSDQYRRLKTN